MQPLIWHKLAFAGIVSTCIYSLVMSFVFFIFKTKDSWNVVKMYHCQFLLLICLFIVVGLKKKTFTALLSSL